MNGRRKRELVDSFRLLASDERWFLRDLLAGTVAFAVWAAFTGVLVTQVARALGRSLGVAAGEPTPLAVAVFGVLWVAVPAVAVAVRVRRRTRNVSGNLERYYRVDHPATLLVPAIVPVLALGAVAFALGRAPPFFALAMVPAVLYLLVRTLAFSRRVYSFSHPLLVEFALGFSVAALVPAVLADVATAAGRGPLVAAVFRTVGAPAWLAGDVTVATVALTGPQLATVLPVAFVAAYVAVQSVAAFRVRRYEPPVDRSAVEPGQRYPSYFATGARGRAAGTGDGNDTPPADAAPADADSADAADDADEPDLDDVSHTRVFTPPADDGDAASEGEPGGTAGAREAAASTENGAGDVDEDDEPGDEAERCDACDEWVTVDEAVQFCPNCGVLLADE